MQGNDAMVLIYIILSTLTISLIAFAGVFTLSLRERQLNKILIVLVSFSAGVLMGGAFLHLIPESMEQNENTSLFILTGFILFFILEKVLYWRHCHNEKCDVHTFRYMNLIGDFIHNFIDGLIIAAGFTVNMSLGITTVIAIAAHEIPQEIGDLGVLIYGGFQKKKAIVLNFMVALTVVAGGIIGYFIAHDAEKIVSFLLPFAAGGFIYIATTDLIPEIKKEISVGRSTMTLVIFLLGIFIMWMTKAIEI